VLYLDYRDPTESVVIFTEIQDDDLIAQIGQSSGSRTRGVLHLSDIYKSLNQTLDPKRFDASKPMSLPHLEVGLLFESMLEEALARKYGTVRPGEVVSDEGVWMSPDGVNPEAEAVEEFKATFMSSRDGILDVFGIPHVKFQHWFWQIKAYCRALGVRKAILTVFFICGDYTRPFTPQMKRYAMEFSDAEIEENWQLLMRHAREAGLLK
jgi:hypothetical protein